MSYRSRGGNQNAMSIILVLMIGSCMMSIVSSFLGGAGWYTFTLPVEGDKCKPKKNYDKDAEYEIDENGKCVLVE